jgi:transposase
MVARSLTTWGLPAVIVNPAQVRAFAHALGQHAKTDRIDATVIGKTGRSALRPLALYSANPVHLGSRRFLNR